MHGQQNIKIISKMCNKKVKTLNIKKVKNKNKK